STRDRRREQLRGCARGNLDRGVAARVGATTWRKFVDEDRQWLVGVDDRRPWLSTAEPIEIVLAQGPGPPGRQVGYRVALAHRSPGHVGVLDANRGRRRPQVL